MKTLVSELRSALVLTLLLGLLLCGVYPALVWACGRLFFPAQAEGSLLRDPSGRIRGSFLIGQAFAGPGFFHPRPSAAGDGYDASNSSGSNLGPTSRKLHDAIRDAVASYRLENGLPETASVPADAVTSSASGLDPHISPANARLQAPRVARARSLPPDRVLALVAASTEERDLGVLGEPRVNVLLLNARLEGLLP